MPFSGELYERVAGSPTVPDGLPLVVLLTGFTDAGSAVSGLIEYLQDSVQPQPLAVFDNDMLLDYRARRPLVTFDQDHLTEYRPARLELSLAADALGQPFLLLMGYEPDFAWNAFADAVLTLADEYGASTITWAHSIAMPVPHTRPFGTTVSGTRSSLTAAHSVWKPRTQVPATAGHLLEHRFAERGDQVAGFILLVPHYLADTEHPGAVIAVADRIMSATGLVIGTDELREQQKEYLARVEEQVEGNDELGQMISTLEQRHDAYMAGLSGEMGGVEGAAGAFDEGSLPSADELAAELERFLASRPTGDEDKNGLG